MQFIETVKKGAKIFKNDEATSRVFGKSTSVHMPYIVNSPSASTVSSLSQIQKARERKRSDRFFIMYMVVIIVDVVCKKNEQGPDYRACHLLCWCIPYRRSKDRKNADSFILIQ